MTAVAAAAWLSTIGVSAQWRNLPMDGVPLGPDGRPDMNAPVPATPSGRPDLSGIYQPNYRYFRNLAADIGIENVPMTPEARKNEKSTQHMGPHITQP